MKTRLFSTLVLLIFYLFRGKTRQEKRKSKIKLLRNKIHFDFNNKKAKYFAFYFHKH